MLETGACRGHEEFFKENQAKLRWKMYTGALHYFLDIPLLLVTIMGCITMATACPQVCQCNQDYFVYCKGKRIGNSELQNLMAEVPAEARLLDMSSNDIQNLPVGIFARVPNLESLNLASNKLGTLADGVFSGLQDLVDLNLQKNRLNQISSRLWQNLKHLNVLDLSENYIDDIQSSPFIHLSNLRTLHLNKNHIGVIGNDMFSGLGALTTLDVSGNVIQRIANNSFKDLLNLQTLKLSYNQIFKMQSVAFSGLVHLKSLQLDYNKLTDLSLLKSASFERSLLSLSVSHNDLSNIPSDIFVNYRNLQKLHLENNKIKSIARSAFLGMSLDEMSLASNELTAVTREIFLQVRRVLTLDLSMNKIAWIQTGAFDSFRDSVYVLKMDGNTLTQVHPGMFRGMSFLQCLTLANNSIKQIHDGSFIELSRLQELVLSHNKLHTVTKQMLEGPDLDNLVLVCNPLKGFVGFRYEGITKPVNVHMNLSVTTETESLARVQWPYKEGSQIYWSLDISCVHTDSCYIPPKEEYLPPYKTETVIEGLSPLSEYYVCVNPVFVNRKIHIEQCIHVITRRSEVQTTVKTKVTDPVSAGSYYAYAINSSFVTQLSLVQWVLLTVLQHLAFPHP